MMKEECCATQLIDGNGEFNAAGVDRFIKKVKFAECGLSYTVVAIMGPQSSGKSTLMNHLFHTNFREMDASDGKSQTTKGIWLAKCVGIEPCTIAMDVEGTDGRERGEDDTAFEKKSSLFALAISDILIINMWCTDIGRENAANKPLLRTVFQVMMRIFSPRRTTLLFVIRDKSVKIPFEKLKHDLKEEMQKIWNAVPKPQSHESTLLSKIFNVEVVALSNYELQTDKFMEEVVQLRQRFSNSTSQGGLAGDRSGVVPASGFSLSAQDIWKVIKENRDLDLPTHKVMVATIRCGEIATEKLNQLMENKGWLALKVAAKTGPVRGFGDRLTSILNTYLSEYDKEAMDFDEGVRNSTRKKLLESKALDSVHGAYITMLGHLCSEGLEKFKAKLEKSLNEQGSFDSSKCTSCIQSSMLEFDQGCHDATIEKANWETSSSIRKKLQCDIDEHASYVRSVKLLEMNGKYEKKLSTSLTKEVEALLEPGAAEDLWASVRSILNHEINEVVSTLSTVAVGFKLDKQKIAKMEQNLRDYARNVVEQKVRDQSEDKVLSLMKLRFESVLNHDSNSVPRVWKNKKVIKTASKEAHSASLKLLAAMAAIRLDEVKRDNIEQILFSSLVKRARSSTDPLDSNTWEGVSSKDTLIKPVMCKLLWKQFTEESQSLVAHATTEMEAGRWHWKKNLVFAVLANVVSAVVIGAGAG